MQRGHDCANTNLSYGGMIRIAHTANKDRYKLSEAFRALHMAEGAADAEWQACITTKLDLRIFALWVTMGIGVRHSQSEQQLCLKNIQWAC